MAKKKKHSSNKLEIQNAAKTLFANIRFMSPDEPVKTLVITSSIPNEGKSTVSMYLAQAIATSGKKVLLVEADMRRRTLATALQVHPHVGTYAVLSEERTLSEAVVTTAMPNLYFLDVEPSIPNPADIISSKRYKKLVKMLEQEYDYVIFDTPPVGTFVDAAILSTLVDGVILVARPEATKRTELIAAYDQLKKAGANVLGVCANFCESTGSEYYYAYYTQSGKRIDKNSEAPILPQEDPRPTPISYSGKSAISKDEPARKDVWHNEERQAKPEQSEAKQIPVRQSAAQNEEKQKKPSQSETKQAPPRQAPAYQNATRIEPVQQNQEHRNIVEQKQAYQPAMPQKAPQQQSQVDRNLGQAKQVHQPAIPQGVTQQNHENHNIAQSKQIHQGASPQEASRHNQESHNAVQPKQVQHISAQQGPSKQYAAPQNIRKQNQAQPPSGAQNIQQQNPVQRNTQQQNLTQRNVQQQNPAERNIQQQNPGQRNTLPPNPVLPNPVLRNVSRNSSAYSKKRKK